MPKNVWPKEFIKGNKIIKDIIDYSRSKVNSHFYTKQNQFFYLKSELWSTSNKILLIRILFKNFVEFKVNWIPNWIYLNSPFVNGMIWFQFHFLILKRIPHKSLNYNSKSYIAFCSNFFTIFMKGGSIINFKQHLDLSK